MVGSTKRKLLGCVAAASLLVVSRTNFPATLGSLGHLLSILHRNGTMRCARRFNCGPSVGAEFFIAVRPDLFDLASDAL